MQLAFSGIKDHKSHHLKKRWPVLVGERKMRGFIRSLLSSKMQEDTFELDNVSGNLHNPILWKNVRRSRFLHLPSWAQTMIKTHENEYCLGLLSWHDRIRQSAGAISFPFTCFNYLKALLNIVNTHLQKHKKCIVTHAVPSSVYGL